MLFRSRCFGSMGYLMFFLLTGTLVNNSQRPVCGHIYADYVINFCFFCVTTIVSLLVLVKFEIPYRAPVELPYARRLKTIFCNKHYGYFSTAVAFLGFSHTVISQFHASLLTHTTLGHATFAAINTFLHLGAPLGFVMSQKLINCLGSINMLFASLMVYMLNHFACSFVTSPWHVVPLGFLEGFTFSSSFVVCVTYLASSSPFDYLTTVQGKKGSFSRFKDDVALICVRKAHEQTRTSTLIQQLPAIVDCLFVRDAVSFFSLKASPNGEMVSNISGTADRQVRILEIIDRKDSVFEKRLKKVRKG